MKTLAILYYLYLAYGTVGQGRTSILELARWMRVSKTTMKNQVLELAKMGLLIVEKTKAMNGYEKYFVSLSSDGQEHLDNHWKQAYEAYSLHVAETVELMTARARGLSLEAYIKVSKQERRAIEAGQKRMFEDE